MASRSTLRFLLAALPVFEGAFELCDPGDSACAAKSSALLQHGQSRADDESLYGAALAPICKDAADFLPEREMWAYCDFYGHGAVLPDEARQPWQKSWQSLACLRLFAPEEATCNAQDGCYGGMGWCHCEGKEGCLAVGGYWFAQTCTMEVEMFRRKGWGEFFCLLNSCECGTCPASQEQREMLHLADSSGSCLDLEAGDRDFEHNKTMWAWCDTYEAAPSVDECNSNGCEGNEWHCHCETKEGCAAVGGRWDEYQCWQDLMYMSTEVHKGIAMAKSQHSCDDIEVWHSPLMYSVDWLGGSCCSSGQSVCQELGGSGGGHHHHHTSAGR
ncbi:ispH [Symbiodinium sp. CCMP2592]|nr:ispH [Symbiodinium sp. CCMP2592]